MGNGEQRSVSLTIGTVSLKLRTDWSDQKLRRVHDRVNDQLRELLGGRIDSSPQVLTLVAFQLAEALLETEDELDALRRQIGEVANDALRELESDDPHR